MNEQFRLGNDVAVLLELIALSKEGRGFGLAPEMFKAIREGYEYLLCEIPADDLLDRCQSETEAWKNSPYYGSYNPQNRTSSIEQLL